MRFLFAPVAALLAIYDLGSLPAGADTAKRFKTDVAAVFGACEKTWSEAHALRSEGMGKNAPTVVKDTPEALSQTVQILDRNNQKAAQNMSCQSQRKHQKDDALFLRLVNDILLDFQQPFAYVMFT